MAAQAKTILKFGYSLRPNMKKNKVPTSFRFGIFLVIILLDCEVFEDRKHVPRLLEYPGLSTKDYPRFSTKKPLIKVC